ncbi:hypothetical protein F5Y18DRAFT_411738 [Xylariaceae sp. FL1019]|nr:hypothetical protein F5Y18DRAFT_411738 [Xylariaceae sp. FL1019]
MRHLRLLIGFKLLTESLRWTNLEYDCICNNGTGPGLRYYQATMPTFLCQHAFSDCLSSSAGNAEAQSNCTNRIGHYCGTLEVPNDLSPTSSSDSQTPTTTSSSSSSSLASTSSLTSTTASSGAGSTTLSSTTTTKSTTSSSLSAGGTGPATTSDEGLSFGGLPAGAKAGTGIGVALPVLIAIVASVWLMKRRRQRLTKRLDASARASSGPSDIPEVREHGMGHWSGLPHIPELETTANIAEADSSHPDGRFPYAVGGYTLHAGYMHEPQELASHVDRTSLQQELTTYFDRASSPQELQASPPANHQSQEQGYYGPPRELSGTPFSDRPTQHSPGAYEGHQHSGQLGQGQVDDLVKSGEETQWHAPVVTSEHQQAPTSATPTMIATWTAAAEAGQENRDEMIKRLEEEERELDAAIEDGERIQRMKEQRQAIRQQLSEARGVR